MGFYAKRLNEFSIGQFIVTKIQWSMSLIILLKLFDAVWWVYAISLVSLLLITWLIGVYVQRAGLWDNYIKESLKKGLR